MKRWEAITRIVEAFVASGRPGYALSALIIICLSVTIVCACAIFATTMMPSGAIRQAVEVVTGTDHRASH